MHIHSNNDNDIIPLTQGRQHKRNKDEKKRHEIYSNTYTKTRKIKTKREQLQSSNPIYFTKKQ